MRDRLRTLRPVNHATADGVTLIHVPSAMQARAFKRRGLGYATTSCELSRPRRQIVPQSGHSASADITPADALRIRAQAAAGTLAARARPTPCTTKSANPALSQSLAYVDTTRKALVAADSGFRCSTRHDFGRFIASVPPKGSTLEADRFAANAPHARLAVLGVDEMARHCEQPRIVANQSAGAQRFGFISASTGLKRNRSASAAPARARGPEPPR